jgi:hypothetical protein
VSIEWVTPLILMVPGSNLSQASNYCY